MCRTQSVEHCFSSASQHIASASPRSSVCSVEAVLYGIFNKLYRHCLNCFSDCFSKVHEKHPVITESKTSFFYRFKTKDRSHYLTNLTVGYSPHVTRNRPGQWYVSKDIELSSIFAYFTWTIFCWVLWGLEEHAVLTVKNTAQSLLAVKFMCMKVDTFPHV